MPRRGGVMYDYVIVGAGSAGCVLASRLTEDPAVRVLLLEAGPVDDDPNIHTPLGWLKLSRERFDWGYESAPEEACGQRRIPLPRGRVLGGSSSTNAMIYVRGNPQDYDGWNVDGWTWRELLPYFLKAEDNERGVSDLHAVGGPLAVSDPPALHPMSEAFLEAGAAAGLARNRDFNGERQDGVGAFQFTQRGGERASTAVAYLAPARGRENLSVITSAHVTSVTLQGGRAEGVQAICDGRAATFSAAREVIVCAGAYNSPQLLMLSGIGPAEHLRARGIEVVVDRPSVGENLSEHAASELLWTAPEPQERAARRRWRSMKLLLATQSGAFASGLAEVGAFARLAPSDTAPEIQLHFVPVRFLDGEDDTEEAHGAWISPCLLTPQSRGTVRLASADPTEPPIVHNAFYADAEDRRRMIAGLRLAIDICAREPLREFCSEPFTVPPGDSDEALDEHLARTTFAFYHPVGTCRMGAGPAAVVDPALRVTGVDGLRVIDASVMPSVPRGNTNAPTIALAERAADLVRNGI